MIVKGLLDLLYGIFDVLTLPISIPGIPDGVKEIIATALDYITSGVGILAQFFDMNYLLGLFSIVIIIEGAVLVYKFVLWVLKKIPMLGIE